MEVWDTLSRARTKTPDWLLGYASQDENASQPNNSDRINQYDSNNKYF